MEYEIVFFLMEYEIVFSLIFQLQKSSDRVAQGVGLRWEGSPVFRCVSVTHYHGTTSLLSTTQTTSHPHQPGFMTFLWLQ